MTDPWLQARTVFSILLDGIIEFWQAILQRQLLISKALESLSTYIHRNGSEAPREETTYPTDINGWSFSRISRVLLEGKPKDCYFLT